MLHKGGISFLIRIEGLLAEGGQHVEITAVLSLHKRIIGWIAFDIARCI